jgi:DNA-binding SARP family transcriptional activator
VYELVQVDLLGPLNVTVNGKLVTPTAPKPRQVLTLLAVCANQVVRKERIIEEVWQDRPPSQVATALQTYVYILRKSLGLAMSRGAGASGARSSLQTFAGGYLLRLDLDHLDSTRFEQQARRGRAEFAAGNIAGAAEALREALALWRGPAMVDVNRGPVLLTECLRLEEVHKATVALRIEADTLLGRHEEVLSELIQLVAVQPTHEGFQAKLMLALYRCGRRSESLRAYQQAREALRKELGVEPSYQLQRLHQAVLAGEPHLDTSSPSPFWTAWKAGPERRIGAESVHG